MEHLRLGKIKGTKVSPPEELYNFNPKTMVVQKFESNNGDEWSQIFGPINDKNRDKADAKKKTKELYFKYLRNTYPNDVSFRE